MSGRHQQGYIWKKGHAWYGRWYEDVIVGSGIERKPRARKLAPYNDRYRNETDVRPILDAILGPINDGRSSPVSTLTITQFYEKFFRPHIKAECKPSTVVAYDSIWKPYLFGKLKSRVLRDFRCVDATGLFAEIHAKHDVGRVTISNCKRLLSSIFRYAKQTGALDGVNPITDSGIPRKAAKSKPTHATTVEEMVAMMAALDGDSKTAIALMFFCGLRPGEARGARWENYDGKRLQIVTTVWRTHVYEPKTVESAAWVPVCEPLRSILNARRRPVGFILAGPSGKPLNLANLAKRVVRPALRKQKVPWYGWYAMRRGIGTLTTAVESSLAAKGLLRHMNIGTTQQFYIKDVPGDTANAMIKVEAVFEEQMKSKSIKQPLSNSAGRVEVVSAL
jgi:integrase